ncbi:MAG: hypothetical protein QMD12_03210 [Candidatus Aenigmarchaeota archaeon]|nr:hypothetical protein [Candidatus Aenigmarchaeota archaeon]
MLLEARKILKAWIENGWCEFVRFHDSIITSLHIITKIFDVFSNDPITAQLF